MDSKEKELFNRLEELDKYQENEQQNLVVRNDSLLNVFKSLCKKVYF